MNSEREITFLFKNGFGLHISRISKKCFSDKRYNFIIMKFKIKEFKLICRIMELIETIYKTLYL